MKKNAYISIMLIIIFSCQEREKYQISYNKKEAFITFKYNETDSIKINNNNKPKVFFALDTECPLCSSYSKTINDLYQKYKDKVDFYGFFPSRFFDERKINQFLKNNYFEMNLIIDTNQILTYFLDARITPESFFLDENLNTMYRGLINDWIKELGRKGQRINNHYLENAIQLYLNHERITITNTNAIGCIIERL